MTLFSFKLVALPFSRVREESKANKILTSVTYLYILSVLHSDSQVEKLLSVDTRSKSHVLLFQLPDALLVRVDLVYQVFDIPSLLVQFLSLLVCEQSSAVRFILASKQRFFECFPGFLNYWVNKYKEMYVPPFSS